MISPELIRRYPFFAGLKHEHIVALANVADEQQVEAGEFFFHEGDEICCFYIPIQGKVGIGMELPDTETEQSVAGQLVGVLKTKTTILSTVGAGEVFGWSGLVPPHTASASASALTLCRVLRFDCTKLYPTFEEDCEFGFLMMQKAAQVIRARLRDLRVESLAFINP